jgi:hypothetical protein
MLIRNSERPTTQDFGSQTCYAMNPLPQPRHHRLLENVRWHFLSMRFGLIKKLVQLAQEIGANLALIFKLNVDLGPLCQFLSSGDKC